MTNDINKQFFNAVGRHFVTLSCVQTIPESSTEKPLLFSGFMVDIRGVWFYITAGHILRDIRASLASGGKFDIWRLGDQTAGNLFNDTAIPFDFDIDRWIVIEDEEEGLDYAALALNELYCRCLHAGGVTPINNEGWGNHLTEYDQWILVGVPSESVTYDEKSIITARPTMLPIIPCEEPKAAGKRASNQFYGRIKQDSLSEKIDIDGMSGGPIFGVMRCDQKLRYKVIGVQSSWYPLSRVIAACPFSSLAHALEKLVVSVRSDEGNLSQAPPLN